MAQDQDHKQGIAAKLGLGDVFDGFKVIKSRIDMQGWNSTHQFFDVALKFAHEPKLVIELGVWKGMSCIHMAEVIKAKGLDCEILAIDTWLGSSAHLSAARRDELSPDHGYPTLYKTFMSNVKSAGHDDVIVPLPMDGNSAAYALKRLKVKADVIHIDASHEYESALADFRNYWELLNPNGIMIMDDYGNFPGVTRAACQFAAEVDRPLFGSHGKALLPKNANMSFDMRFKGKKRYNRKDV